MIGIGKFVRACGKKSVSDRFFAKGRSIYHELLVFGSTIQSLADEVSETPDRSRVRLLSSGKLATKLEIFLEAIDDGVGRE
jgi:hypothetical protein